MPIAYGPEGEEIAHHEPPAGFQTIVLAVLDPADEDNQGGRMIGPPLHLYAVPGDWPIPREWIIQEGEVTIAGLALLPPQTLEWFAEARDWIPPHLPPLVSEFRGKSGRMQAVIRQDTSWVGVRVHFSEQRTYGELRTFFHLVTNEVENLGYNLIAGADPVTGCVLGDLVGIHDPDYIGPDSEFLISPQGLRWGKWFQVEGNRLGQPAPTPDEIESFRQRVAQLADNLLNSSS